MMDLFVVQDQHSAFHEIDLAINPVVHGDSSAEINTIRLPSMNKIVGK